MKEKLVRPCSCDMDKILGKKFDVLDDGFVRVVDYMGTDQSVVQAARVSYGEGTKKVSEDRGLIRYLLRHRHTTPFEMCEVKLHVRVPMDCWRQWIRHRTANVNEYSTRYSVAIDSFQKTPKNKWRLQAKGNKQGSSGVLNEEDGLNFSIQENTLHLLSQQLYNQRIDSGIAREQARKDLPLSTYTEAYWKIDLHNLLHFLSLRMEGKAQKEIREYAQVIGDEIVSKWVPLTWEAFWDYNFDSMNLSRLESQVLTAINLGLTQKALQMAKSFGWLEKNKDVLKRNRERQEFEEKLISLGLTIPW